MRTPSGHGEAGFAVPTRRCRASGRLACGVLARLSFDAQPFDDAAELGEAVPALRLFGVDPENPVPIRIEGRRQAAREPRAHGACGLGRLRGRKLQSPSRRVLEEHDCSAVAGPRTNRADPVRRSEVGVREPGKSSCLDIAKLARQRRSEICLASARPLRSPRPSPRRVGCSRAFRAGARPSSPRLPNSIRSPYAIYPIRPCSRRSVSITSEASTV